MVESPFLYFWTRHYPGGDGSKFSEKE